jgi:hypothetical protein
MFSPALMGIEAWAGVPGTLHARERLEVSKMGLLVIHFRCTIVGSSSWVEEPKGSYLGIVREVLEKVYWVMYEGFGGVLSALRFHRAAVAKDLARPA